MKILFIFNDAPYGSERTYNGLRLAGSLSKREGNEVRLFMMGDSASAAHRNQKVPQGFYNVEVMIGNVIRHGGKAGVCGTCMDARGLADSDLAENTHRSTLAELTEWTEWSDKTLVF